MRTIQKWQINYLGIKAVLMGLKMLMHNVLIIPAQVSRTRSEDSAASHTQPAVDLTTRQLCVLTARVWSKSTTVYLLSESWIESRGNGCPTLPRRGLPLLASACYDIKKCGSH